MEYIYRGQPSAKKNLIFWVKLSKKVYNFLQWLHSKFTNAHSISPQLIIICNLHKRLNIKDWIEQTQNVLLSKRHNIHTFWTRTVNLVIALFNLRTLSKLRLLICTLMQFRQTNLRKRNKPRCHKTNKDQKLNMVATDRFFLNYRRSR